MSMKNMAMTKEEMKESKPTAVNDMSPDDAPKYPYGLRLDLNDDVISKLGLKSLPKVGQSLILQAKVEVCSVSEYETQGKEAEQSICLQITDMEVAGVKKVVGTEKLYK